MANTAVAANDMLVGASVLSATGQMLGRVDSVAGSRFHCQVPSATEGRWLDVADIGLFTAGCIILAHP